MLISKQQDRVTRRYEIDILPPSCQPVHDFLESISAKAERKDPFEREWRGVASQGGISLQGNASKER